MSEETPKIKFEYQNPTNVEAEVPGSQNIREVNESTMEFDEQNTDGAVSNITEIQNGGSFRVVKRTYAETRSEMIQGGEITQTTIKLTSNDGNEEVKEVTAIEERKQKTKIPKLKFRQTVEKVKAEQRIAKEADDSESPKSKINRRSKIPPPSTKPIVTKRNSALMYDEFEKIYYDLIDDQILGTDIDDPEKLDLKFEEIIHDYDENKVQPINVEAVRQSRIPFRRKSEQADTSKASANDTKDVTNAVATIKFSRSKSVHDADRSKSVKKIKDNTGKDKTKHTSSIPLPRRKSGQDGDISKTTYNKTETDGVITETVTTVTKSAPISQVILQKGRISTSVHENKVSEIDNAKENQNIEDTSESKAIVDKSLLKKSIPRLIDSKNDGKKVIRTYTRTVTTEKVVSGKDNKLIVSNVEEKTNHEPKSKDKPSTEIIAIVKEGDKPVRTHILQEENIVKDSIRIGIPSFESKSESPEENAKTVQVTKILEWNTNVDMKDPNQVNKSEAKESGIIKSDNKLDVISASFEVVSSNNRIDSSGTETSYNNEENSLKSIETVKETSTVNATSASVEKLITSEKELISEIKDTIVREGSRFNKVSNLTILKGIDHDDEILKSPRLLNKASDTEVDVILRSKFDENLKSPRSTTDTKVFEVLESPKIDKDGNEDLLPEYNIRIKRFSREMKHDTDSLKQWEKSEKVITEDGSKLITTESKASDIKVEITDMGNARKLLSRVLDREKKIDTIKNKGEEELTHLDLDQRSETDPHISTKYKEEKTKIKTLKTQELSINKTNEIKQEINEQQNSENDIEFVVKGKVGKIVNKIYSKEFNNATVKKEEEVPIRRSVLSTVAMFERQEPLDSKTRKSRVESMLPKLTIKGDQSPVHVHTPKIVEEVLKSADWDSNFNNVKDENENTWKIDFDKIILNRKDIYNSNLNENVQETKSLAEDVGLDSKSNEIAQSGLNVLEENKTELTSDIIQIKETDIKENILTPISKDFKVQISDDYSTVNLEQSNVTNVEIVELRNKLKVDEPSFRDMATSPTRLSFDAKDFESKIKNQVLTDAPVILVHPKINDNMSKSTEAIFSTQPKLEVKTSKKVDRTTSMTEKLYPEKVKANIALYESIKNEPYIRGNKSENRMVERASSSIIFETYKSERYDKANKVENRAPYTPQNSINSEFASVNESTSDKHTNQYKYKTSISVDDTKARTRTDNLYRQKYGSLQFINEAIDKETFNDESIKSESITEMNKSIYRLTFDDKNTDVDDYENTSQDTKRDIRQFEEIGIRPINEIVLDSYEIYSKTDRTKFKSIHEHEDDETGERMIKSLPNIEYGDVKGRVKLLSRKKSVNKYEDRKDIINIKEMPRKLSVLEKIALFEGKAQQTRTEQTTLRSRITTTPVATTQSYTEKEYQDRIEELQNAKEKYGSISKMPTLTLRTQQKMPVLAVGTAMLDPRLLKDIIGAAIDLGYRAIDTAYIYGNEKYIGEAIKAKIADGTVKREDIFVMGKLWSTFHRTDLVEPACKASLEALGLDYFDLYMIHNPMSFKEGPDPIPKIATVLQYSTSDYLDAWYGMEKLVDKGLAKSIGVSNFNSVQIQRILDKGKIKPSVNQVECHPYLNQQRLDHYCTERDIKLSCFGTLGSKGTPDEYKGSLTVAIDDALVKVMASGLNVTAAQLLIRYQLECERSVVVKSSTAAHLWDNLQALNFNLTTGQVEAMHALNRNKRIFTFKGMGDTHKNYPFKIAF